MESRTFSRFLRQSTNSDTPLNFYKSPNYNWQQISNENKNAREAYIIYFSNKLKFEKKTLQTRDDNQGNQKEGSWLEIFHLLIETRKATGFTSPRVNCWNINQVTSRYQIGFTKLVQVSSFETKYAQNWYIQSKAKRVNTPLSSAYLKQLQYHISA